MKMTSFGSLAVVAVLTISSVQAFGDTFPEGGLRHARLQSDPSSSMAGAARISIDFLKTRTANGGSSAVSYSASPAEFNVTFNKGDAECAQLGPITLEMQGQSLVPGTDSVPLQTLELQRKGDQPCQYSARLDSYTIDSYADGRHYDYRQYLRIKVRSAHALIDPFTHGEWFQLQLSGVPEND